jgi:hypothetical protein
LQNSSLDIKNLIIPGTNVYFGDIIKQIKLTPEVKSLYHND